jgi:hypothetical protein
MNAGPVAVQVMISTLPAFALILVPCIGKARHYAAPCVVALVFSGQQHNQDGR